MSYDEDALKGFGHQEYTEAALKGFGHKDYTDAALKGFGHKDYTDAALKGFGRKNYNKAALKGGKLVKGSRAAKERMAYLRSLKGSGRSSGHGEGHHSRSKKLRGGVAVSTVLSMLPMALQVAGTLFKGIKWIADRRNKKKMEGGMYIPGILPPAKAPSQNHLSFVKDYREVLKTGDDAAIQKFLVENVKRWNDPEGRETVERMYNFFKKT